MEYEVKPPKTIAERLHCAAHVTTPPFSDDGRGGTPELVKQDWMAACSASGDPMGEAACMVKYCGANGRGDVERALHRWGWNRWAEVGRKGKIDADLHQRMADLVVAEFLDTGPLSQNRRLECLGLGMRKWKALQPHYRELSTRLLNGERAVLWHVSRMVR